jgi:2-iminobutanoate/2-iminopropanoate deaminase
METPPMKSASLILAVVLLSPMVAHAQGLQHFAVVRPPGAPPGPGGASPPFSAAVRAGDTVYVAGTTDGGDATMQPGEPPEAAARRVMENFKREVEAGGATMDDLAWVQVFCADLGLYAKFNEVYRTYFKGPMPARAFLGADHLLGNARFEVMGIAVKPAK